MLAAVGLAGSSIAITSLFAKVWPAGFAHQDPLRESCGAHPEMHLPRVSAVIATESFVFPQFFNRLLWRIGALKLLLRIRCFVHSRERFVAT